MYEGGVSAACRTRSCELGSVVAAPPDAALAATFLATAASHMASASGYLESEANGDGSSVVSRCRLSRMVCSASRLGPSASWSEENMAGIPTTCIPHMRMHDVPSKDDVMNSLC